MQRMMVDLAEKRALALQVCVLQRVNLLAQAIHKFLIRRVIGEPVVQVLNAKHVNNGQFINVKGFSVLARVNIALGLFDQVTQFLLTLQPEIQSIVTIREN
jgi:predicted dehydrogenase